MSNPDNGFQLLSDELNPAVVKQALKWRTHPELNRLVGKLLSHTSRKAFLDSYAEALVAYHLMKQGCAVRFEVPTPRGKRCDFEVHPRGARSERRFYLHVKRMDTQRSSAELNRKRGYSARLRALERIARPYIVQVGWSENVSSAQMQSLVKQAESFIRAARVGDELAVRDDHGHVMGGVRILAPWEGDHVNITIGLHRGTENQADRFYKLLQRAHAQFMPKAVNVVLIASDHAEDAVDFENALLGSHVERWDAFPKRGRRLAYGRAADGFWHGQRHDDSHFAGWFHFAPREAKLRSRLWMRREVALDERIGAALHRLFEKRR